MAGNEGEPPSANDESCPLTGGLCGDEVEASNCISSPSESSNDDEFVIQGIGESKGVAVVAGLKGEEEEGDAEAERSMGEVELEDIVEACPNMDVSPDPGDNEYVSAT